MDETGATVQVENRPIISGDPIQLKRVFQNLLENALKYRSERKPRIVIRAEERPWDWLISVQDNGRGMEPEKAARIFEPLQWQSGSTIYPGRVGMGLAICHKIITRIGGGIWAKSSPGQSTTVCFTIPHHP